MRKYVVSHISIRCLFRAFRYRKVSEKIFLILTWVSSEKLPV